MEIFAFLVILSIAILLVVWGFGFFRPSKPSQEHRSKSRLPLPPAPKVLEPQKRDTARLAKPTLPAPPFQNKTTPTSTHLIAPRQSSALKKRRVQLPQNKHQQNIQRGDRVLQQLRSKATSVELPMAIAILRQMNPYAFEELLLTCLSGSGLADSAQLSL